MGRWDALKPDESTRVHRNNQNNHNALNKTKTKSNDKNTETRKPTGNNPNLVTNGEETSPIPLNASKPTNRRSHHSSCSSDNVRKDGTTEIVRRYEELRQQVVHSRKSCLSLYGANDDDDDTKLHMNRLVSKLANTISSPQFLEVLPAEQVALETVYEIFLPFWLEASSSTCISLHMRDKQIKTSSVANAFSQSSTLAVLPRVDDSSLSSSFLSSFCGVGSCLRILLNDSRYASAMMAPLVKDVAVSTIRNDGQVGADKESEEEVILLTETQNPIRCRLFQVLQQKLMETSTAVSSTTSRTTTSWTTILNRSRVLACLCQTLSTALDVSCSMDRGTTSTTMTMTKYHYCDSSGIDFSNNNHKSTGKTAEVDFAMIRSFLSQVIMSSETAVEDEDDDSNHGEFPVLLSAALELFRAVLKRYPDAASSFASLLLLENHQNDIATINSRKGSTPGNTCRRERQCCCASISASSGGSNRSCSSSLLSLIHTANLEAIGCAVDLLDNIPLQTWLSSPRATGNNATSITTPPPSFVLLRSTLSFPQRLVCGLENLIRTAECLLLRITSSNTREDIKRSSFSNAQSSAILSLVTSLLVRIPYAHAPSLQPWAVRLVAIIANSIVLAHATTSSTMTTATTMRKRIADYSQNQIKSTTSSNSSSTSSYTAAAVTAIMMDAFLAAAGGRVTPLGETTNMSMPMRLWLASEQGETFLGTILTRIGSSRHQTNHHHRDHHLRGGSSTGCSRSYIAVNASLGQVLRSIFKSHPELVYNNPALWKRFVTCFESLTSQGSGDCDSVKQGMELLEGILEGRSRSVMVDGKAWEDVGRLLQITPSIQDTMLRTLLHDGPVAGGCKAVICSSYSVLLPRDWDDLDANTSGGCLVHVRPILRLCLRESLNLRADSFKALGNICSNYFSSTRIMSLTGDKDQEAFCEELCSTMVQGCCDQSPKVRCMALFALGNLCHVLLQHPALSTLIDDQALESAIACVMSCMDDSDDKVKGNATRSVGYVACLVLQRNLGVQYSAFDSTSFFRRLLQSLERQITGALLLLRAEHVRSLTWKERQALKKQGWGACNTLTRLFESGIIRRDDLSEGILEALRRLVDCVTRLSELNEKVASAACASLRAAFSSDDGAASILLIMGKLDAFIGRCLWSCISFLFQGRCGRSRGEVVTNSIKDSKLRNEVELLLSVLLENASISDANVILERSCSSDHSNVLTWLYEWMDHHSSTAHAYSSVALAMSNRVDVDADIEIRFSNRAMFISDQDEEL